MCILRSMQPIVYSLLILVSVFSDCVVFYGDSFLWDCTGNTDALEILPMRKVWLQALAVLILVDSVFFSRAVHRG